MAKIEKRHKLLEKARRAPNSLRYSDLCRLAEYFGWELERHEGTSHRIYFNPGLAGRPGELMNFQNRSGMAKPYQVRQLVSAIDELSGDPEGH
ncbi:MAG: type II toxin-antitoxin system HicA family toxin [Acidobacteriota bacterium]|nr:MAG: type II toxin-antitoxin system HicA family toxin [Acidobacteriota bacterium]